MYTNQKKETFANIWLRAKDKAIIDAIAKDRGWTKYKVIQEMVRQFTTK